MKQDLAAISLEQIEEKYKSLIKRRDALIQSKFKIEAELSSRKRQLKSILEEAKKAGFDPDDLPAEIKKHKEILLTKMNILEAELNEAENRIKPMLQEISEK
jgi:hypothetical protein